MLARPREVQHRTHKADRAHGTRNAHKPVDKQQQPLRRDRVPVHRHEDRNGARVADCRTGRGGVPQENAAGGTAARELPGCAVMGQGDAQGAARECAPRASEQARAHLRPWPVCRRSPSRQRVARPPCDRIGRQRRARTLGRRPRRAHQTRWHPASAGGSWDDRGMVALASTARQADSSSSSTPRGPSETTGVSHGDGTRTAEAREERQRGGGEGEDSKEQKHRGAIGADPRQERQEEQQAQSGRELR